MDVILMTLTKAVMLEGSMPGAVFVSKVRTYSTDTDQKLMEDLVAVICAAKGKRQKKVTVDAIADKVFDKCGDNSGKETINFHELYTAILLAYNDINKRLPGPHQDPPSREEVEDLLKEFDTNEDGVLDREEFHAFLRKFTRNLYHGVTKTLVIYSIAPLLALAAKRATEQLPRVGPVVRHIPNFFYATVVTTFVAFLGHTKQIED